MVFGGEGLRRSFARGGRDMSTPLHFNGLCVIEAAFILLYFIKIASDKHIYFATSEFVAKFARADRPEAPAEGKAGGMQPT